MINASHQKKVWIGSNLEQSPTHPSSVNTEHLSLMPDEPEQPYSDMYDGPIHPLRLLKGQDTSLAEWVPYREIYLSVLHDMEAPPNPRVCIKCGGDGMFRPVLCSMCCIEVHQLNPFHKIERWAGTFFEDYSLRLALSCTLAMGENHVPAVDTQAVTYPLAWKMNGKTWTQLDTHHI
ncbi:hypothetical protein EDC04DRAFT_2608835 [Pisolithus marmoratus]|nr:hypothetical protein EDC04DRAFT_2608835 [Pisolithus marmoratus]